MSLLTVIAVNLKRIAAIAGQNTPQFFYFLARFFTSSDNIKYSQIGCPEI